MRIEEVADRLEIAELLARYCHALDDRDWPAFRALFATDATVDYTAFGGPRGDVAELEAFLIPVVAGLAGTQHTISTTVIALAGDRATARSAAIVPMTALAEDAREATSLIGLWYEDVLVRTSAGWRFQARRQVRGWASAPI